MDYVVTAFKVAGSIGMGYLLLKSNTARGTKDWKEAYYCLGFAAVAALILN